MPEASGSRSKRDDLLSIYDAALKRVSGVDTVKHYLQQHPLEGRYRLIAIGKAASAMSLGALDVMGSVIDAGLVITKYDHLDTRLRDYANLQLIESDHPVPGEASLQAGKTLIDFIKASPTDAKFLVLISGGASSLVEVLPQAFDLQKLRALTAAMLANGLSIDEMNRIRRSLSLIKGGRLVKYFAGRPALGLFISDVPDNDPAVIGSGLLTRATDEVDLDALPSVVASYLTGLPPVELPSLEAFTNVVTHVIATLDDAKLAAAQRASELGYPTVMYGDFLEDDAARTAQALVDKLAHKKSGVHIWGGETSVKLPDSPGRGGRNQHLALAAALALTQTHAPVLQRESSLAILAAGTDGTDGPTEDAGALVDGETVARGELGGFSASTCLQNADAGTFLEASGDLIHTGPTNTNVMDLVIALKSDNLAV